MPRENRHGRGSTAVDVYVGQRLRARRTLLSLSLMALADAIGLTFQQLQKYEKGADRISASRLYDLSRVLGVDIEYFFEDMDEDTKKASPAQATKRKDLTSPNGLPQAYDPMHKSEALALVRAYYRISDPHIRWYLRKLVQSMATASSGRTENVCSKGA